MRQAFITAHGGPDCISIEETEAPGIMAGHVLVAVEAAGLNFHDVIDRRTGYPGQPAPPLPTGLEAAGTITEVGEGVPDLCVGDRVVWGYVPASHAEIVRVPAAMAIPIPPWIDSTVAAAVCAQGLTAHYLTRSVYCPSSGQTALVWAAAGGVGRFLVQMLARYGVRVVAAASTDEKIAVAKEAGAELAVLYDDVAAAVAELTDGAGVDVVFDGIGGPTFDSSLASVRRRGLLVVYGRSGGPVPPVDLSRLSSAGSVQLVRPRFSDYVVTRDEQLGRASDLFAWLQDGTVTSRIDRTFAFAEIAGAHELLESRTVTGKIILTF
jgi:NADPH2:quinone reductase